MNPESSEASERPDLPAVASEVAPAPEGAESPSPACRDDWRVPWLLGLGGTLFGLGVGFPFFHVTKFWVFSDAVSVIGGIGTLWHEGEWFLFGVLTLFTLIFPVVKLVLLLVIWLERAHNLERVARLHKAVAQLGKWSMLDVFVVAILIVVVKSAGLASIRVGWGLYCFTFSVVATQFASAALDHMLEQR